MMARIFLPPFRAVILRDTFEICFSRRAISIPHDVLAFMKCSAPGLDFLWQAPVFLIACMPRQLDLVRMKPHFVSCPQCHVLHPLLKNSPSDRSLYSLSRESYNYNVFVKFSLVYSHLKSISAYFSFVLSNYKVEDKSRPHINSLLEKEVEVS
jgi:hypothetical protein